MRFVLKQRVRQGRCILSVISLQRIAAFNVVGMSVDTHTQIQVCPPLSTITGVAHCCWKALLLEER